jgi:hypothetical protein
VEALSPSCSLDVTARKSGSSHHNIAMDGALNHALLDPRLSRVGQSRLPAPAWNNRHSSGWGYHSASRARIIAGLSGFLTLIQSRVGPDLHGAPSRFETMPSRPILQACWKIVAPSSSMSSLGRCRAGARPAALPDDSCGRLAVGCGGPRRRAPEGRTRTAWPRASTEPDRSASSLRHHPTSCRLSH